MNYEEAEIAQRLKELVAELKAGSINAKAALIEFFEMLLEDQENS